MKNIEKIKNKDMSDKKEFILLKDNNFYNLIVYISNDFIFLKCLSYEAKFKIEEFSQLIKCKFNSIQEGLDYLNTLFINEKIEIKDIISNDKIILKIKIDENSTNQENEIYIYLIDNKINKDYMINKIYNSNLILEKELKQLKGGNINMEKELKGNKLNDIDKNKFSDNLNIKSIISIKAFTRNPKENTFSLFNSIDDILILIYSTKEYSIISHNINNNKKMIEVKNAHDDDIIGFNHFLDNKNKKDLIMSISALNFLKIWDTKNWECILHLSKINNNGLLSSACFLKNNINECFIITSNSNYGVGTEKIKIFNLEGKIIKELTNSNEDTSYVDTYYEDEKSKIYIIVCIKYYIKSYDYSENKLYHKYSEKKEGHHYSAFINKTEGIVKLIESCIVDGFIRIWNFHHGNLLCKINTNMKVCSLCLWNYKYLISGSLDGKILIIDLLNQIVIKTIEGHKNWINCIRKFKNNKYGECLITQGFDDQIQIWTNNI